MAILNEELMEKARGAKSAEELLAIAKENNIEIAEEQANAYFEHMNKTGELSDDELDSVAGGGCGKKTESGPPFNPMLPVDEHATCEHWQEPRLYIHVPLDEGHVCGNCGQTYREAGFTYLYCGYWGAEGFVK